MKNMFSPIELQVIDNLLADSPDVLKDFKVKMLREKIREMKAAGPKTLREKALDYLEATIDNPDVSDESRVSAASFVLIHLDHNNDSLYKSVEFEPAKCPPDTMYAIPEPERWTGDDIPPSARIKDLDCSTPKQPFHAPVLTEFGRTAVMPVASPAQAKAYEELKKIAAEDGSLKGHCPSHRIALYPDGICPVCDYEKHKEPMTLSHAVEVLNEHKHRGFDDWAIKPGMGDPSGSVQPACIQKFNQLQLMNEFTSKESIAIAEKLEREK